ncbi:MAG: efflux RND transporter permease subunit, partial [Gammaproteobacteria bacterium]
ADQNIIAIVQQSAHAIARPVFFAVLIVVIVFAPIFSLQGVEGKLFHPMAQAIVLSMLASLLVALIVMPALAVYVFKNGIRHHRSATLAFMRKHYKRFLLFSFRKAKLVIVSSIILLLIALLSIRFIGAEFVPELEEGTLNIRVTLAPSSSLKTSLQVAQVLEEQLMTFPEVIYASSRIGRPELGGDPEPVSNIEILVGLKPVSQWTSARDRQALQQRMLEKLSMFPGILFSFSQPIATRVDELLSGVKAQLAIKLFGPDLQVLADKGREIEAVVQRVDGTRDVAIEQMSGEAQLVIHPNRDALVRYGITVDQVMSLVANAIGGETAGQIITGNERYDIYVRLAEPYRDSVSAIADLILKSPTGAWVNLGDIASIDIATGSPQIRRDDVQRRIVVQANVEGRDMGGVVNEIQTRIIEQIQLPEGYVVTYGGQFENQQRAQARLMIIVPLSLFLIFLLLYFAFSSAVQALLIMVNVPLALIGGIFALLLTGQFLSVPSSIGFIALFGIAVLNGVVLVSEINHRVKANADFTSAIFYAALSRLRPVLLTAITAALGLIPMLLSRGVGAEIQRPLATVVVGGLFSATLLTLILLPVLYRLILAGAEKATR